MGGKYPENIWELHLYVISDKTDVLKILQKFMKGHCVTSRDGSWNLAGTCMEIQTATLKP